MKTLFLALVCAALGTYTAAAQTWATLTNAPPAGVSLCLLLTDGSVICLSTNLDNLAPWYKLTPDINGSYPNGAWSAIASMPAGYVPEAAAEVVLADGRVVMVGGEYNYGNFALTNLGAIYDPVADTWTMIAPPPFDHFTCIGDAPSTVLADGRLIIGSKLFQDVAILDPATLTWTLVSATGKIDAFNSEEGWELLPDGSFFTLDVENAPASERFILTGTSTGMWVSAGDTPQDLHTPTEISGGLMAPGCPVYYPPGEVGPTPLRPDGTVFAVGADGYTGIYTPPAAGSSAQGSWAQGPSFQPLTAEDAPAAVLPSGNVLFGGSPSDGSGGLQYFEFDGTNLNPVPAPGNAVYDATGNTSLLVLPSGQVMFVDGGTTVQIYTPAASPSYNPAWAPTISSAPQSVTAGMTYAISGTQFNGMDQGSAYGDEYQNSTNYPLVRITNNSTGHVFYARTHDHSSMGVATGSATVSTNFDVPANIEAGASTLAVVANGIPSAPAAVTVSVPASGAAPVVSTGAPQFSGTSVTLTGMVSPDGADTQVWFEYSTNSAMTGSTSTTLQDVGVGTDAIPISATLNGLTGATTYYYRAWAMNNAGKATGNIATATLINLSAGYNNLGPENSYSGGYWCITGSSNGDCGPAEERLVAAPFTPVATHPLGSIGVVLTYGAGTDSAQISLLADAAGVPGASLETWTVNNLPSDYTPSTTTVQDQMSLTLHAGQQYWVEVQPTAQGTDTLLYWFISSLGLGGAYTNIGSGGWQPVGAQPAFEVGLAAAPAINAGGVVSASAFGEFGVVAPGGWIEIYGSNLAPDTRPWGSGDFNAVNAPTQLDGTSVTIGGEPAYVAFISPGQVNVQLPFDIGVGSQPIIVTTQAGGASVPIFMQVNATSPGLLSPASFNINGNQYAVALFPDFSTYVLPTGAIAGINSRPAQAGDTIILYGVGFGPVTPVIPAGILVPGLNSLDAPLQVFFNGVQATLNYDGLAPNYVGLYQFNLAVPSGVSGNLVPLTFTLNGVAGTQTLYLAVQ